VWQLALLFLLEMPSSETTSEPLLLRPLDHVLILSYRRDILERSLLSSAGKLLEGGTGDAVSI